MAGTEDSRTIPLVWVELEDKEIAFTNQLLVQHYGSEFILSFGQMSPPALLGSQAERESALEGLRFVPVKTVARVGFTAANMREFVRVMSENLDSYEASKESRT